MHSSQLFERARLYLEEETDPFFAQQVRDLVAQNNIAEL